MLENDSVYKDALRVARLYYYQELTTEAIAHEMGLSRSKVSRLLAFARDNGLVEIRVVDSQRYLGELEQKLKAHFDIPVINVVSVPETAGERAWLERVAKFSANYLNGLIGDECVLALAWGTTLSTISQHLTPKQVRNLNVVQLNGSGNTSNISNTYASEILMRFARNYHGRTHPLPVPTFFDYPETKQAMWRERSIEQIVDLQERAHIYLYSIGAVEAGVPSHVHSGGYLEPRDVQEIKEQGVVGDIATVFFRADGSYRDIPLNARASGPDLELFRQAQRAVCVVSGLGKVPGLRAALEGGYLSDLIVDEHTARGLLE